MTTAPPNFKPILESAGFGEVDYLGVGKEQLVPDTVPQSWVEKERARRAASQMQQSAPDISDEYVNSTIEEMELAQNYPDLTADEWAKLHSKEDKARGHFTLAEAQKMEDIRIKWVKSVGEPIAVESQNGVTMETWQRDHALVYSVKNADGTKFDWEINATLGLRLHLNPHGEIICSDKDNYQVSKQKTDRTFFVDCTRSAGLPQKPLPISGTINNRKALIPAALWPDGRISIGFARGAIEKHQFVVKLPTTGAFATVDENGQAMLAQLDKLPKNIPLSEQDIANHNAFAAQIANGELSLDEFIGEDRSIEHHQIKNVVFSEEVKKRSHTFYQNLLKLEKSGYLPDASSDIFRTDKPALQRYVHAISQNSQSSNMRSR